MLKVLVPVYGSSNSQHAVQHVLREFQSNPAMDIHLHNVKPPFSRYITRWVDRKAVKEEHAEASDKVLRPIRQIPMKPAHHLRCTSPSMTRQLQSQRLPSNCDATTSASAPGSYRSWSSGRSRPLRPTRSSLWVGPCLSNQTSAWAVHVASTGVSPITPSPTGPLWLTLPIRIFHLGQCAQP